MPELYFKNKNNFLSFKKQFVYFIDNAIINRKSVFIIGNNGI
jgi:hypothetical protein